MNRLPPKSYRWFVLVAIAGMWTMPHVAWSQQPEQKPSVNLNEPHATHPLDPAMRLAEASLANIQENIQDYTALFAKRCRVDGVLPPMQFANVKIRNRKKQDGKITTSMAVYLDFLKPASVKGREVVWVEDQNDGKLVAHDTGFMKLVSVSLDPKGYVAMRGQRHPITEIGIEKLATKLLETGNRDKQHGECEVQFFKKAKIGETTCTMLQVIHPVKREHFDFYRARVYFDDKLNIPIRYESWSWPLTPDGPPVLEEEYTYLRVKVNVGLTDLDFDTSNPAYRFR